MYLVDASTAVMVCGPKVFKVTLGGATTQIGTVPDDATPVHMAWNGQRMLIASSGSCWGVTLDGTVSTFVRDNIGMVDTIGSYFILSRNDENRFFYMFESDGFILDELNIEQTNSASDVLVGCRTSRRTAYFFGTKSIEPWYLTDNVDSPFNRIDGGVFEVGTIAKHSIAELDAIFFLGGDESGVGAVWTLEGGSPKRISTPAIEFAINKWPTISDAEAFTYSQEGHAFYVLSSNSGNETWVYDITTGKWHQRAWLHPSGELRRIRPRCHLYFAGKHLVGDWENGNVYQYDLNTYSDNGNPMPSIRAFPCMFAGFEQIKTMTVQLDMDTGFGTTTGQGEEPQAMLRWSRDGGMTWSNALWRSFGRIGEYSTRCIWNRVGGGLRVVFEVTITDPVRRNITGAFAQ
jgi:hypothetical protein